MAGAGDRLPAVYLVTIRPVAFSGEVVEAAVEGCLPELPVLVEVGRGSLVRIGVEVKKATLATAMTLVVLVIVTRQEFGRRLDEGGGGGVGGCLETVPHGC